MTHDPRTIVITDPRTFDGDPYEVAERACQQFGALAGVLAESMEPLRIMVRNAELERQLAAGDPADATAWEDGSQAKQLEVIKNDLESAQRRMRYMGAAAGFNPKKPPKE